MSMQESATRLASKFQQSKFGQSRLGQRLFENAANMITTAGLILTAGTWVAVVYYPQNIGSITILVASTMVSDFLDGLVARATNVTYLGATLDRIRDKLFICSIFPMLLWRYGGPLFDQPHFLVGLTLAALSAMLLVELFLFAGWIAVVSKNLGVDQSKRLAIAAQTPGKIKMNLECATIAIWMAGLNMEKYCNIPTFHWLFYLISGLLVIATYFAVLSLESHYKRYELERTDRNGNQKPTP